MKNVLIIISMVLLTVATSCAQKLSADKVPSVVMTAFKAKYPTAERVKWSMENAKEYEAEFIMNKSEQSANFSADGKWMESETEIEKSQLPQAVIDAIKKLYPKGKIDEVEQGSNNEIALFYGITLKSEGKKFDVDIKATGEVIQNVEVKKEQKEEKD